MTIIHVLCGYKLLESLQEKLELVYFGAISEEKRSPLSIEARNYLKSVFISELRWNHMFHQIIKTSFLLKFLL